MFAIVQKERLGRQGAAGIAAAQMQRGTQRDQRGRVIADGRAIGDIAPQRGRRPHLGRAVAPDQIGIGGVVAGRHLQHLRHADTSANAQRGAIIAGGDGLQIAGAVQKNHLWQRAHLLGDPQPHICGPAHQRGIGVLHVKRRQRIAAFGQPCLGRAGQGGGGLLIGVHPFGDWQVLASAGRAQNRRIARAAAQVAGKGGFVIGFTVQMCHSHRGHKTRRAKTALAAVVGDHRLLHRVQLPVGAADTLDRAQRPPVQLRQQQDAGIDRLAGGGAAQHDGAGAAIALVAALFGAGQAPRLAQPIQRCHHRVDAAQLHALSVQKKGDIHVD